MQLGENGLYVPHVVAVRYGDELALTAAALLEAYRTLQGGVGPDVLVPVTEMLFALGLSDTPECRAKLRQKILKLGQIEQVGARMEQGVVSLWLTPALQERVARYPRVQLLEAA